MGVRGESTGVRWPVAGGLGHISHLGRLLKLLWILREFLLRHVCHLLLFFV